MKSIAPRLPLRVPPVLLGGLLFLAFFWLGLQLNFPGAALSRLVSARLSRLPGVGVELSPVRLSWRGLGADSLLVRDAADGRTLLSLRNLWVPLSWRLVRGVPLEAELGKSGRLALTWAWGGEVTLQSLDARLEDLPLPVSPPSSAVLPFSARGAVHLEGRLGAPTSGPLAALPEGELRGRGENLEIGPMQAQGMNLPPVRLDVVDLSLRLGPTVQVERLTFQGDLQGSLAGSILPVLGKPQESRLNLTLSTEFRQSWINQLGDLRSAAQGLLQGGRLEATVGGTLGAPAILRAARRP